MSLERGLSSEDGLIPSLYAFSLNT